MSIRIEITPGKNASLMGEIVLANDSGAPLEGAYVKVIPAGALAQRQVTLMPGQGMRLPLSEDSFTAETIKVELWHEEVLLETYELPLEEEAQLLGRFITVKNAAKARYGVEHTAVLHLETRQDEIVTSSLARAFLQGTPLSQQDKLAGDIGEALQEVKLLMPLSLDAHQRRAALWANEGASFILDGAPRTGRSQAICGIIANALYRGKRVLFISERESSLETVKKRLNAIGVGAFCLYIKQENTKADALGQLAQVMDMARHNGPQDLGEGMRQLTQQLTQLDAPIQALNAIRPSGLSVGQAILELEKVKTAKGTLRLPGDIARAMTAGKWAQWQEITRVFATLCAKCGGAAHHPLKELTPQSGEEGLKEQLEGALRGYATTLEGLLALLPTFAAALGFECRTRGQVEALLQLAQLLANAQQLSPSLIARRDLPNLKQDITALLAAGNARDEARQTLLLDFEESLFSLDVTQLLNQWTKAQSAWALNKRIQTLRIRRILKQHARSRQCDATRMEQTLAALSAYAGHQQALSALVTQLNPLLRGLAARGQWDEVAQTLVSAQNMQAVIKRLSQSDEAYIKNLERIAHDTLIALPFESEAGALLLQRVLHLTGEQEAAYKLLKEKAGVDVGQIAYQGEWLAFLRKKVSQWLMGLSGLEEWCAYVDGRKTLVKAGLGALVEAYQSAALGEKELISALQRAMYTATIETFLYDEEALSAFDGAQYEGRVQALRQAAKRMEQLSVLEIIARLSAALPTGEDFAPSSEISMLRRAIAGKGWESSITLSELLRQLPGLLRLLSPCIMLKPSLAMHEIQTDDFDLVVVDDAAHMPMALALPFIARAKAAIVAGDGSGTFTEGNLLKHALAMDLPRVELRWQYGGGHESIAAFANKGAYQGRLYTFPHCEAAKRCVTLVKADVAANVASRAAEIFKQQGTPSVGIAVLAPSLGDDIRAALQKQATNNSALAQAIAGIHIWEQGAIVEPCDTIFIAATQKVASAQGTALVYTAALYALGQLQLIVPPDALPSDMGAPLALLMRYAQGEDIPTENTAELDFLQKAVQDMGYDAAQGIGLSQNRVDLAVESKQTSEGYVMGIQMDGAFYAETDCYDRNVILEAVFGQRGWHIQRLWALDWFNDSDRQMNAMYQQIGQSQHSGAGGGPGVPYNAMVRARIKVPQRAQGVLPYEECTLPAVAASMEEFFAEQSEGVLTEQIGQVLAIEAPISRDLMRQRLLSAWKIARPTQRVNGRIDEALKGVTATKEGDSIFLWQDAQQAKGFNLLRAKGERGRRLEDVPFKELQLGIRQVINAQIGLSMQDLQAQLRLLFGDEGETANMDDRVLQSLRACEQQGDILLKGERVLKKY